MVGGAILQTGLAKTVGNSISQLAKGNETRAFIFVVLATSFIGAFVSNTGTVAIMMPIVMSMAASSGIRSSRLLMPIARDSRLRQDYSVTVLGIHRDKNYIKEELSDHRLQNGDTLLVQGKWKKIMQMNQENENWVVLGKPDKQMEKVLLDYKAPVAAAIMLLMIVAMVFDFIPISPVVAVAIAGLLMVFSGCFRNVDAAYKTINLNSG